MTSQPPPPPVVPEEPNRPSTGSTKRPIWRRTWVGWVGGILVGVLIGAAAGADDPSDTVEAEAAAEPAPTETVTVVETEEPEPVPAETVTVEADAEPQPAETVTVTETVTPEEAAPDAASSDDDVLSVGQWEFGDVQVSRDGLDDFEVRARVTNTGGTVDGVVWTVTMFSSGSVVGTASASATDVAGGSTTTQTFITQDDYVDGVDSVEFQVDAEF